MNIHTISSVYTARDGVFKKNIDLVFPRKFPRLSAAYKPGPANTLARDYIDPLFGKLP